MKKNNNPNTDIKPRKRPAFKHSKNSRGMKLLWHPSTVITTGKFAGWSFGDVLKKFGKTALPELLKYYRISSTIMDKYHCTLKPHDDKSPAAMVGQNKPLLQENNPVVPESGVSVTNQVAKVAESTDALDSANRVEIDDPRWTSSRSDYENNILYDPEDDVPDAFNENLFMGGGGHQSYWDEAS